MPAGLQIFNSSGVLTGNYTQNYGRHLNTIYTGDYPGNSITDAGLLSGRPWFQIYLASNTLFSWDIAENISVSGSVLSWSPIPGSFQCYIAYGVY